jgi:hypothetical protein
VGGEQDLARNRNIGPRVIAVAHDLSVVLNK